MDRVFVDTSFYKGMVDPLDKFNQDTVRVAAELKSEEISLVTTNFILDEAFTLVRVKCGLEKAIKLWDLMGESFRAKVYRVRLGDEAEAWKWFKNDWSGLSFTDCTSFAAMKRLGIEKVATFDEHFARAGFRVLK